MEKNIEIPEITKASVDYALQLPKHYDNIMLVSHRKGFEAGAKWQQDRIDELEEKICQLEKDIEYWEEKAKGYYDML